MEKYERGEIARNVSLQEVAKRLKEDNEHLRGENEALKVEMKEIKAKLSAQVGIAPENNAVISKLDPLTPSATFESSPVGTSWKKRDGNVDAGSANEASVIGTRKRLKGTFHPRCILFYVTLNLVFVT